MSKETTDKKKPEDLHPDNAPDTSELNALTAVEKSSPGALVPGEASGDIDATDIKMPIFRVIQKMSDNPAKLDYGTLTVNGDLVVEGEAGCTATIVSIAKKYEEILPFGAGIPRRFDHLEDAVKEGYTLCRSRAQRDSGVPLVEEMAIIVLACHKPDGALDRSFPFEVDAVRFIPALWFVKSTAYGSIAKTVFSKRHFDLKDRDLLEARWLITAEKRKNSYGEFFVPQIRLLEESNSPEFITGLRKQLLFSS